MRAYFHASELALALAPQGDYMHHVETMLKQQQTRLSLSLDELRTFDAELTRSGVRNALSQDQMPGSACTMLC